MSEEKITSIFEQMEPSKDEKAVGSSEVDKDRVGEEEKTRKERIHLKKQNRKMKMLTIMADKCRTRSHSRMAAKMAAEAVKKSARARLHQTQEKDKNFERRKKRIGRKTGSTGFQRSYKIKQLSTSENRDNIFIEPSDKATTRIESFSTKTAVEDILETDGEVTKISNDKYYDQGIHKEIDKNDSVVFGAIQNRLHKEENTSSSGEYKIIASTFGSCSNNKEAHDLVIEKRKLNADSADELSIVHQPRQLRKRKKLLNYNENAAFNLSFKKSRVVDNPDSTNGTLVVTKEVDKINSTPQITPVSNTNTSVLDRVTNSEGGPSVTSMTSTPQFFGSKPNLTDLATVNSDLQPTQQIYRYLRTIACQTEHTHHPKETSLCNFCQKSKVITTSTSVNHAVVQTPSDNMPSYQKASSSNGPSVPVTTCGPVSEKRADRTVQPVRKLVPLLPAPPQQPFHGTVLNLGNTGSSSLMQVYLPPNILPAGGTATIRIQQPVTMQYVLPSRPILNTVQLTTTSSASASGVLPSVQRSSVIRAPNKTIQSPFPQPQMRLLLPKSQGSTETPQQAIAASMTLSNVTCSATPVTTGSKLIEFIHSLDPPLKDQDRQANLSVSLPLSSPMGNDLGKSCQVAAVGQLNQVSSPQNKTEGIKSLMLNESFSTTDSSNPSDLNLSVIEDEQWSICELLEQIVNSEDSSDLLSTITEQDKLESKDKNQIDASECCHCHRVFPDARSLTNHSLLHLINGLHECPLCGGFFACINLLESHVRLHKFKGINSKEGKVLFPGNAQPFSCVLCQMKFVYLGDLARHKHNHKQQLPGVLPNYHCIHCDKQFFLQGQLIVHRILSHEDGVMTKCFLCGLELCDSNELVKHTQEVHLGTKSNTLRLQPLQESNWLENSTKSQDITVATSFSKTVSFSTCAAPSSAPTAVTEIRTCNRNEVAPRCFEKQDLHEAPTSVSNIQLASDSAAVHTEPRNGDNFLVMPDTHATSGVSSLPVDITAKDSATSLVSDSSAVTSRYFAQTTDVPTTLPTKQTFSSSPITRTSTVNAGVSVTTTTLESTNHHTVMASECDFPLSLDMPTKTQTSKAATCDGTWPRVITDQNLTKQLMTNLTSGTNQLTGKVSGSEKVLYRCSVCTVKFETADEFTQHCNNCQGHSAVNYELWQQNKSYECSKCSLKFEVATDLVLHSRVCQKKKTNTVATAECESSRCPKCNLDFVDRPNELANHINHCHNRSININTTQNAASKCPGNLSTIKNVTLSELRKGYKCHSCKLAFSTASELATHVSHFQEWKDVYFPDNRRFECSSCQLTFPTAADLASHIRGYKTAVKKATARKFKMVNSTNKVASYQDSLPRDATKHDSVFPHVSSMNESSVSESASNYASSAFGKKANKVKDSKHFERSQDSTKRSLENTAFATVSFECTGCRLNFRSLAALTRHRKLKHECRLCNVEFTLTSELLAHFDASHSGVNYSESNNVGQLICKVCEKRFHTAQGLLDHFKQHQRFRCPGCKNGFTQRPDFNTHIEQCNKALGRKVYPET